MTQVETGVQTTVGVEQAALALAVSSMTVRRMIRRGQLKAELVNGRSGKEWRITLDKPPLRYPNTNEQIKGQPSVAESPNGANPISDLVNLVRELQAKVDRLQEERARLISKVAQYEVRVKKRRDARSRQVESSQSMGEVLSSA